jgi:cytochrome c oxidase assembly factor CtaG/putative copper export protein
MDDESQRLEAGKPGDSRLKFWVLAWIVVGVSALLGSSWVASRPETAAVGSAANGIDSGGTLLALLEVFAYGAGIVTFGFLLAAAALDPQGKKGFVSRLGQRDLRVASTAAVGWAVMALLTSLVSFADYLNLPLGQALSPSVLSTFFWSVPQATALAVTAVLAAVIAVLARFTVSLGVTAVAALGAATGLAYPSLAVHPIAMGDHSLPMTASVLHIVAASAWLGILLTLCVHALRGADGLPAALVRYRPIWTTCIVVVGLSGLADAYVHMSDASQLLTTDYGRLVLVNVVLFSAVVAMGWWSRGWVPTRVAGSSGRAAFGRIAALQVVVMTAAVAVSVGMTQASEPRVEAGPATVAEQLLGFTMPPAPTFSSIAFGWHPETFMLVIGVLCGALYVAGVIRLRRAGNDWPPGRTITWLLGCVVMVWATNAGIAAYASATFSWHMLQHMVLSMLVPILLVLGAPVTLALRALHPSHGARRGPREWIVWSLGTPVMRFFTQPLVALLLYGGSVYVLYFTPLFTVLMDNHIGHLAMQVHFVLTGYLFYWVVIGIDYAPRRLPHWLRLLLVIASLPLHAFFSVAFMLSPTPLSGTWFTQVQPPWLDNLMQDQNVAAGIAWAFGEVPTLIVVLALAVQWSRSDERESKRRDRKADRDGDAELKAYNDHLSLLAQKDKTSR